MTINTDWRTAALAQLARTDLQVSLAYVAIVWLSILFLPRWWAFGVILFFGFFYVRMHQIIMHREEQLETFGQQPHENGPGSRLVIRSPQ